MNILDLGYDKRYEQSVKTYADYGYDVPKSGKYKRTLNRIYFEGDFQDGEPIHFFWSAEKPNAIAKGNIFYKSNGGVSRLINLNEIEKNAIK